MKKQHLSERIRAISNDITRLSEVLSAMDKAGTQKRLENYELLAVDAALRSEQISCRLRHLIYGSTSQRKQEYLTSTSIIHGIHIESRDRLVEVTLPCLLPHRKATGSGEFLLDPIYTALDNYEATHGFPKFEQCVVCFCHVYSHAMAPQRVRDYDNVELKQFLDLIATFVMTDDSGLLCDAYNTTELGATDYTRISVMEQEQFYDWLETRKNRMKSISDF